VQTCVVKLTDREAVIDKLVYTAANPVVDHLVDRVDHWPGVNGLSALLAGRPLRATRPLHFFRPDGAMRDALELPLTLPAELGPAAAVLAELRDRVLVIELERAAERGRTGRRVLGRRAVLAQSWRDSRRAWSPGGTSGPGSHHEASGRGSRRCCAIVRSSSSTPVPARDGETVFPPCSHRAPIGSSDSRRCECSRPDLVRVAEDRTEHRRARCADTAWCLGCLARPRIGQSTSDALVDRGRGPSVAIGLYNDAQTQRGQCRCPRGAGRRFIRSSEATSYGSSPSRLASRTISSPGQLGSSHRQPHR